LQVETHLQSKSKLSRKKNEFSDVLTMVHQANNHHTQAVMNNLKFILLDY